MHQRLHVQPRQFLATLQEIQLDHELKSHYFALELPYKLDYSLGRAPGREHIIDNEHPIPDVDRIAMHFEDVGAILQLVLDPLRRSRKLPGLSHRNKPRAQRIS